MSESLIVSNGTAVIAATTETPEGNYIVQGATAAVELKRDIDFGVIPGTKSPSLFKSGAERVCFAYGLMQRFAIESATENLTGDSLLCFYRVRCDLYKGFTDGDGMYREVIYANGYGSANTTEKRNGMNSAFNAANSTLKMAEKRALVDASLHVSGLSSMFTQDMEDSTQQRAEDITLASDPKANINKKQFDRIKHYATAYLGWNKEQISTWLNATFGVAKSGEITQEMFPEVMKALENLKKEKE